MSITRLCRIALAASLACAVPLASASLTTAFGVSGNVGLSVDGVGGGASPVGEVQAVIPVGATILRAYLYSAGVPSPYYAGAPTTAADYNAAGITLAGTAITNFDTIVGATSTRADIGRWYTGRADVTTLIQSLVAGAVTTNFSWEVTEGLRLNHLIDGETLAIAYSHASLPEGSVVFLNGGQNTGGETTNVNFASAIDDPLAPGFLAAFGIASSFSCCSQQSTIRVNGSLLTEDAGNFDDGALLSDGSLITVGGVGDDPSNNLGYDGDDELYDLRPFLSTGDTGFSIETFNATNDDNIFFAHLYTTARVRDVNDDPIDPRPVPLPPTALLAVAALALLPRRKRAA